MRISAACALALSLLLLCSCGGEAKTEGVFDYQSTVSRLEGTLEKNGGEYGVIMFFEKEEKGENVCKKIEFTSPETVKGVTFEKTEVGIVASAGDAAISDSPFAEEEVFSPCRLLALAEKDIIKIEKGSEGDTVITGENGHFRWRAQTSEEGAPMVLSLNDGSGEERLEIQKIEKHQS